VLHHLEIDAQSEEGVFDDQEISYRDEIAARLKLCLRLPEYGDVKLKLTLGQAGNVAKLVIESAESKTNRQYVEKTLPCLTFPALGHFGGGADHTFLITLSNE
jgi:hypothetical protein